MEYDDGFNLYELVQDMESTFRKHEEFAKEIYTEQDDGYYLKESFILKVIKQLLTVFLFFNS